MQTLRTAKSRKYPHGMSVRDVLKEVIELINLSGCKDDDLYGSSTIDDKPRTFYSAVAFVAHEHRISAELQNRSMAAFEKILRNLGYRNIDQLKHSGMTWKEVRDLIVRASREAY